MGGFGCEVFKGIYFVFVGLGFVLGVGGCFVVVKDCVVVIV